jgi:hypothetical protein
MKKIFAFTVALGLGYLPMAASMPAQVKTSNEKKAGEETINRAKQDYASLAQELNKTAPTFLVVSALGNAIAENTLAFQGQLDDAQRATNKALTSYFAKRQKDLNNLVAQGYAATFWLTAVAESPQGTYTAQEIQGFIETGRACRNNILKLDCDPNPTFQTQFNLLLQNPKIKPFAAQQ